MNVEVIRQQNKNIKKNNYRKRKMEPSTGCATSRTNQST